MPTFRGTLDERQILLTAWVSNPSPDANIRRPYRALLDTGATISAISQKALIELELSQDGWMPIDGVHLTEDLPTCSVGIHVPITELSQGQQQPITTTRGFNRMKVTIMGHQSSRFDVLLGMDLLMDFHLTIYKDHFIISN